MINKLKKEIKSIKWPSKEKVKKDIILVLISSSALMLFTSIIKAITQLLMNLIF